MSAPRWVFIGTTVLLPLDHLSGVVGAAHAPLIAAFVLCAGAGFGLMVLAADAVRDRS